MRYDDLITAQWDLIIIDEAHRLGGSTDQVARYRLGRGLADAASYVLLLAAAIGTAILFHLAIELPVQRWLSARLIRKNRSPQPSS